MHACMYVRMYELINKKAASIIINMNIFQITTNALFAKPKTEDRTQNSFKWHSSKTG